MGGLRFEYPNWQKCQLIAKRAKISATTTGIETIAGTYSIAERLFNGDRKEILIQLRNPSSKSSQIPTCSGQAFGVAGRIILAWDEFIRISDCERFLLDGECHTLFGRGARRTIVVSMLRSMMMLQLLGGIILDFGRHKCQETRKPFRPFV